MLAVFLVPLVVVYAHNEHSYKAMYSEAMLEAAAAKSAMQSQGVRHQQEVSRSSEVIAVMNEKLGRYEIDLGRATAEVATLERDVAQAESFQGDVSSKLAVISSALESGQQVVSSLLSEVQALRIANVTSQKQMVELDEALRDALLSLQEAREARRALEEEVTRLGRINDQQMSEMLAYRQQYGELPDVAIGDLGGGRTPTKQLDANVLSVKKSSDGQTYLELDAGSRDGVEMDWVLTIKQNGQFVALIRITEVDINRSVGVVTLDGSIPVSQGQQASSFRR
jgi:hypothetical protein